MSEEVKEGKKPCPKCWKGYKSVETHLNERHHLMTCAETGNLSPYVPPEDDRETCPKCQKFVNPGGMSQHDWAKHDPQNPDLQQQ